MAYFLTYRAYRGSHLRRVPNSFFYSVFNPDYSGPVERSRSVEPPGGDIEKTRTRPPPPDLESPTTVHRAAPPGLPMLSLLNLRLGVLGPEWESALSSVADMETRGLSRPPPRGGSSSSSESLPPPPYGGKICWLGANVVNFFLTLSLLWATLFLHTRQQSR